MHDFKLEDYYSMKRNQLSLHGCLLYIYVSIIANHALFRFIDSFIPTFACNNDIVINLKS